MPKINEHWPAEYRSELEDILAVADGARQYIILRAVENFCRWNAANGNGKLNREVLRAHVAQRKVGATSGNKWELRQLRNICILGPDQELRDWCFENFRDTRSDREILAAPWWPATLRHLAAAMHSREKQRILQELDNYLRWTSRTGGVAGDPTLEGLFLAEDITERTRYQRLSRLCTGLETLSPGDPDLTALRAAMTRLRRILWPRSGRVGGGALRIPPVEALLREHIAARTERPYSESTIKSYRIALNRHHDLLARAGRPFGFDKAALDLHADYAFEKLDAWTKSKGQSGWSAGSTATQLMRLAPFIPDKSLRREWRAFANDFIRLGTKTGHVKAKERSLAERPMDLESYFRLASTLLDRALAMRDPQVRHGILVVVGAMGILLFYPLRISDVRRLRWGESLRRTVSGWRLSLPTTQKTGSPVDTLQLPPEANPFIDACLLGGTRSEALAMVYEERCGEPMLKSPRNEGPYELTSLGRLIRRWTPHGPHMLRSIWCDELVARGADRTLIAAMLQHESLLSQKEYEIIAGKLRRVQAMEALVEIADRAEPRGAHLPDTVLRDRSVARRAASGRQARKVSATTWASG